MKLKGTLALMLIIGAAIVGSAMYFLPGISKIIYSGVGLGIIMVAGIGLIFSSLYVKAKGNLAYVKTGQGGPEVIKDKGRIIIGFLHDIIPVSLETMKIAVDRAGKESLITLDKMRAEVVAEFYIRVRADADKDAKGVGYSGIQTAARTLGDKISAAASRGGKFDQRSLLEAQTNAVKELEKEKLIDALRTVAAKVSLEDLNLKRDEFKRGVMEVVKDGLEQNGLELEDCTISSLDQAPMSVMDPTNSFDAQGLRNLQKILSEASIVTNQYKREAELAITRRDVETRKAVLEQEQDIKFKESDQQREVRTYQSEQNKAASVAEIKNQEEVAKRGIEKEKVIGIETVSKEQTVARASVEKEKVLQTATVEQQRAIEVAERDRQIAVATKDAERAKAQTAMNIAEAESEKARQDVETVKVAQTAEREKQKAIINKQATIEQARQEEQMKADVTAYKTQKEAEGRKLAAEADYDAKVKAAKAQKETLEMDAIGKRAQQMVPVEVAEKQVAVDTKRINDVLKPELEAKAAHQQISVELELGKLQIIAQQAVGVEYAKSIGLMTSNANMTLFGDPTTLAAMAEKFSKGLGLGQMVSGLNAGNDQIMPMVQSVMEKTGMTMGDLIKKVTGSKPTVVEPASDEKK
jgi:flotillin